MAETPPTGTRVQTFGNLRIYHEDTAQVAPKKVEHAAQRPISDATVNQIWRDTATQQPLLRSRDVRPGNLIIGNTVVSSKALAASEVAHPMIQHSTAQKKAWTSDPQILDAEVARLPHSDSSAEFSAKWKEKIQLSAESVNDRIRVPATTLENVSWILEQKTGFLARLMVKIHAFVHSIFSSYTKSYSIEDTRGLFRAMPQADQSSAPPSTDVQPQSDHASAPPSPDVQPQHQLAQSAPSILQAEAQSLSPQERIQVELEAIGLLAFQALDLRTQNEAHRKALGAASKPYIDAREKLEAMPSETQALNRNLNALFSRLSELHEIHLAESRAKAVLDSKTEELTTAETALSEASKRKWITWLVGDPDLQLAITQARLHLSHAERLYADHEAKYQEVAAQYQAEFKGFVENYQHASKRGLEKVNETIGIITKEGQKIQKQAQSFIALLELLPQYPQKFGEKIYAIIDRAEDSSLPEAILHELREEPLLKAANRPEEGLDKALKICEKGFDELLAKMKNYAIADCGRLQETLEAESAEYGKKIGEESSDQTILSCNAQLEEVNSKIGKNTDQLKAAIASIITSMQEAGKDLHPESIINYLKEHISTQHPKLTEVNYKQFVEAGLQALNQ